MFSQSDIFFKADTSRAENVALFSVGLAMTADGLSNDPKLSMRSGISEKKGVQCFFVQDARCSDAAIVSARSMRFLRCMRVGVAHGIQFRLSLHSCPVSPNSLGESPALLASRQRQTFGRRTCRVVAKSPNRIFIRIENLRLLSRTKQ